MNLTVNSLPAKTWNRLGMNDAKITLEGELHNNIPELRFEGKGISFKEADENTISGAGLKFSEAVKDKKRYVIENEENVSLEEPVVLTYSYSENEQAASRLVIHAKEKSSINVVIFLKGEGKSKAFLETEIYADKNSRINLFTAEILNNESLCAESIVGREEEGAEVNLIRLELGSGKLYSGVNIDLLGKDSTFTTEVGYHAKDKQTLDMNYVVNHYGKNTGCLMEINGTLENNSKKTFRGSIDFKKGCAGSKGTESENVVLLGDELINQTIPLILCAEEDVEGNHGASIGRLDDKILFYLGAKGIPEEEAQKMIALSRIKAILSKIPDEEIRNTIEKFEDERGISYVPEF